MGLKQQVGDKHMPNLKNVLDTLNVLGVKQIDSLRLVWKLEQLGFSQPGIDAAIQDALAGGNMLYTHTGLLSPVLTDPQSPNTLITLQRSPDNPPQDT